MLINSTASEVPIDDTTLYYDDQGVDPKYLHELVVRDTVLIVEPQNLRNGIDDSAKYNGTYLSYCSCGNMIFNHDLFCGKCGQRYKIDESPETITRLCALSLERDGPPPTPEEVEEVTE